VLAQTAKKSALLHAISPAYSRMDFLVWDPGTCDFIRALTIMSMNSSFVIINI